MKTPVAIRTDTPTSVPVPTATPTLPPSIIDDELIDKRWYLARVDSNSGISSDTRIDGEYRVFIEFGGEPNSWEEGYLAYDTGGGCNPFFGGYRINEPNRLKFSRQLAQYDLGCPDIPEDVNQQYRRRILRVLNTAQYKINGGTLKMTGVSGDVFVFTEHENLAQLVEVTPDPRFAPTPVPITDSRLYEDRWVWQESRHANGTLFTPQHIQNRPFSITITDQYYQPAEGGDHRRNLSYWFTVQTACNVRWGFYELVPGGKIRMAEAATTQNACPESAAETFWLTHFAGMIGYTIDDGVLQLTNESGMVFEFVRESVYEKGISAETIPSTNAHWELYSFPLPHDKRFRLYTLLPSQTEQQAWEQIGNDPTIHIDHFAMYDRLADLPSGSTIEVVRDTPRVSDENNIGHFSLAPAPQIANLLAIGQRQGISVNLPANREPSIAIVDSHVTLFSWARDNELDIDYLSHLNEMHFSTLLQPGTPLIVPADFVQP